MADKANLTRQASGEDKVELFLAELSARIQKNLTAIGIAAGAVVLLVLGLVLVQQNRARAEADAGADLLRAQSAFFGGSYDQALAQFQTLADRRGGTRAGASALLFVGNCQLILGHPAEAEAAYRKALGRWGGEPLFKAAALRGVGESLASAGNHAEGAKQLEQAAEIEGNPMAADDWMAAGRSYLEAGARSDAVRAFERVLALSPEGNRIQEARLRIAEARAGS